MKRRELTERTKTNIVQQMSWIKDNYQEVIQEKVIPLTNKFQEEIFQQIKRAFIKNLPIEPDLQRKIKPYTAKVQFVELKFSGINFQSRTINIPKEAIHINCAELKNLLLTKMKLFQNTEANEGFAVFRQLKKKVELLRDDYLKAIMCREGKSVIQVEMKEAFKGRLQKLKQEIQDINQHLPDILKRPLSKQKTLSRQTF